jgi:hypothetical protein
MHANRITIGVITVLVMAGGLVLSGFASPAAAKNIVVTTLNDTADPPFNADGPCGTGTVNDLPGADGQVSLREAIIAANNTRGADTITFAPSLSGGTIKVNFDDLDVDADPDPLPALCGGQTSIKGDLNGDDVPDITLEGSALPPLVPAPGLIVVSCHNTVSGMRVHQFPFGIVVQAGDFPIPGTPGTVEHNTVTSNIVADSSFAGIVAATGDTPGSVLAHTTITRNLTKRNGFLGIWVPANLTPAGAYTQITHTTITGNEVRENGDTGVWIVSFGDHNVISNVTVAHNAVARNPGLGIIAIGGTGGADENTIDVDIKDNAVRDNGFVGIEALSGSDNSSNNHIAARIRGNTLERGDTTAGIVAHAASGAAELSTGASNNNVLEVRIERNTIRNQTGEGMHIGGGSGSPDGRPNAVANGNHTRAVVTDNTVEDNNATGIEADAGEEGLANENTLSVSVAHNTVCNNTGTAILGEGGFSGNALFPPNMGSGNVLTGDISHNTATTVVVQDGTPGNTATVTQSNNTPCL